MEKSRDIRFDTKIIAFRGNKVLCIIYQDNRLNGFLDFPGGQIEAGECELDTCARELREETELEARDLRFVGTVVNASPGRTFDIQVYVSHTITGTPHSPEGNYAAWLPIGYVRKYPKRLPVTHLIDKDRIHLLDGPKPFIQNYTTDEQSNILSQSLKSELEP